MPENKNFICAITIGLLIISAVLILITIFLCKCESCDRYKSRGRRLYGSSNNAWDGNTYSGTVTIGTNTGVCLDHNSPTVKVTFANDKNEFDVTLSSDTGEDATFNNIHYTVNGTKVEVRGENLGDGCNRDLTSCNDKEWALNQQVRDADTECATAAGSDTKALGECITKITAIVLNYKSGDETFTVDDLAGWIRGKDACKPCPIIQCSQLAFWESNASLKKV